MTIKIKHIFFFFFILSVVTSCTPQKKIIYLQEKENKNGSENIKANTYEYTIKAKDQLYITTVPLGEPSSTSLNPSTSSVTTQSGNYLNAYDVSDSGYINLPLAGKVLVNGLTLNECQKEIQKKVDLFLKNSLVIVKLLNFNITVLGEVNNPGTFQVNKNQINILEVLGLAGDMTIYGNRREIMLVRQNEGNKVFNIDITDKNLLYSDYYFLQPNDVLYVKPTRSKIFGTNPFPFSTVLTSITTLILLINYLKK